ncbi:MAG: response regulator transcription factor [Anaerolineaceae bacterium]
MNPQTRVLIIDDQPSFRRHLRQLLSHAGMTVVGEANDITEAVGLVKELQPDILIVDVMLPGESGLDGTLRLKPLNKKMRVFLVSAHHDSAHLFKKIAEEVGAEAFIPKDELDLDVVKKWMQKSE